MLVLPLLWVLSVRVSVRPFVRPSIIVIIIINIIEQGPPEDLVANFHKLFDAKINDTKAAAIRAAKHYGLLPGFL